MPNNPRRVLFASLIGTSIECFDFYIYGMAAVLVFPTLFFPSSDPTSATVASLATLAIAFVARPFGAAFFGHYGDRIGRKSTLVATLVTMGVSTVLIGTLPTYDSIGIAAPIALALCRFGQGFGLGGEWGGAVLLAVENAPRGKRVWFGMFPQLGTPIGFVLAATSFLALSQLLTNEQFLDFGWRIPFLASTVLVAFGLYVRLTIAETPVYAAAALRRTRVIVPVVDIVRHHLAPLAIGVMMPLSSFVLFNLVTVFAMSWGTSELGFTRDEFLVIQLAGAVFSCLIIPLAAVIAERGRRATAIWTNVAIALFGFAMPVLFSLGTTGATIMTIAAMGLVGFSFGPLGTMLSELFPTRVRYSGSSLAFNIAGVVGASVAPLAATALARRYGLTSVGIYVSAAAAVTLIGVLLSKETRDDAL